MKCCIVMDLLHNYINGLTGKKTNAEIRKHLDDCDDCRTIYENILEGTSRERTLENENINFPPKRKEKILRKKAIAIVLACIVILSGLFVFLQNYDLVLPFDPDYTSVKFYKAAVITNEYGNISWLNVNLIRDMIPKDCDQVMDVASLSVPAVDHISMEAAGRTVNRGGKALRVVYFCYQKTLWDSLFFNPGLEEGGSGYEAELYGSNYKNADYEPQMAEIYYVPFKNESALDKLSDEEYDKLREEGTLVWSGII